MYEDIRSSPISRALELRASTSLQSVLIECSLSHLESEFMEFLRVTVASQPRLARLGGRPGTRALVRAYLTIRLPSSSADLSLKNSSLDNSAMNPQDQNDIEYEDGLIDSKPVWPMIYCCMRAGDYRAAVEVARAASNNLDNFASILEDFANSGRRLSATTQSRFRQNCRQVLKTSRDPYKRLIYSILGLCGLNESYSEVARTIDDFLWLKLSHIAAAHQSATSATTSGTASSGIAFEELPTLGQLQTLLYETYGEVHFDAWSQPLVYFKILCLTQQFEGAIGFLARFETLRSHAVHIALALHDSSLLLLPSSLQCALVSRSESDPIGFRRLNLARLVMLFTRKFEVTNPIEALMYFYFLSDIQSESAVNLNDSQRPFDRSTDENLNGATNTKEKTSSLFVKCVCELALATKEFDLLLGCVTESGVRKPGAVDRYCKTSEERQSLVASVAGAVESRGQLVEAIVLYRLAACSGNSKHYLRKSVSLANYLLAGLVAVDNANTTSQAFPRMAGQPDRDLVLRVATELAREVRQSGSSVLGSALSVSMTSEDDDAQSDEGTVISSTKTLFYLLDLATFFDLYQAERWQAAIDHMDQLGLFPTNPQPEHVESRVALFTKLPDFVRRPIPSALLALMRCLAARVSKGRFTAASGDRMESGSSLTVAEARTRAKALIAYVGRIPYRLPGEIYARLTQMDMELM
ncbi:unnamed protein product [Calicophoron daubneyi]|uniref:Nuclear pore protein n=1 Tax=Calicophoron daubneyi TaxID=300641 RepID=A0AAV2THZ4_CALDB